MLLMAIDNQAISKHHQQAHDICTSVCRYICTLGACISFNRLTIESREGGGCSHLCSDQPCWCRFSFFCPRFTFPSYILVNFNHWRESISSEVQSTIFGFLKTKKENLHWHSELELPPLSSGARTLISIQKCHRYSMIHMRRLPHHIHIKVQWIGLSSTGVVPRGLESKFVAITGLQLAASGDFRISVTN